MILDYTYLQYSRFMCAHVHVYEKTNMHYYDLLSLFLNSDVTVNVCELRGCGVCQ